MIFAGFSERLEKNISRVLSYLKHINEESYKFLLCTVSVKLIIQIHIYIQGLEVFWSIRRLRYFVKVEVKAL